MPGGTTRPGGPATDRPRPSAERPGPGPSADGSTPGRVVIVTGGASGIGLATAERFAADEAAVALVDRDAAGLDVAVATISAAGGTALGIVADVRVVADCERSVAAAVDRFGRLDALVNSAGVWVEGPSDTMTEDDWDRVVDVNLKGTFFMCRHAIPALERTGGCIVNVSSDAGLWGNREAAIYCASKGGVTVLTKALAVELAPRGIRANAVCPGDVDSPMIRYQADTFGGGDPDAYLAGLLTAYPQRPARFIRPSEVAELIHYLASPAAAPITGAALSIDFGLTAGY
ncbi:MAG: SDR family oxidoreductase [Chloroflexi bacterium]|nr:SDR family oxidoreductase [Chloroflexota bacterium]